MAIESADSSSGTPSPAPSEEKPSLRVLNSLELFDGQRAIVIQHGEERYRLLITRNDRLILQK
jgi:hemin uptake protein HemP